MKFFDKKSLQNHDEELHNRLKVTLININNIFIINPNFNPTTTTAEYLEILNTIS